MKLKDILNELNSNGGDPTLNASTNQKFDIKNAIRTIEEYNSYGSELGRKMPLPELAKKIKEAVEHASKIALEELSDENWFDKKTIDRNLSEAKKYATEFEKICNEVYQKEKQLEALYDDIGHRLSRYYNIK